MPKPSSFAALIMALVLLAHLNATAVGAPLTLIPELVTDGAVTAIYDPSTGNFRVKSDIGVTSFQVTSSGSLFIPSAVKPGVLKSPFDVMSESKWFILDLDGFTDLDVGPIYPAGMDVDTILTDLSVEGSLKGGGRLDRELGSSPHLYVVPEPSGVMLLGAAALALLAGFRRRTV